MPKLDVSEVDVETLIYALSLATADLKESIADASQTAEDRAAWVEYLKEIEEVSLKLTSGAAIAA
jgi:hypothetical protein